MMNPSAMPVEIMFLPKWWFFNLSRVSYWSRCVIVPLLIIFAKRPVVKLKPEQGVRELFVMDQTFGVQKKRGLELCDAFATRGDLSGLGPLQLLAPSLLEVGALERGHPVCKLAGPGVEPAHFATFIGRTGAGRFVAAAVIASPIRCSASATGSSSRWLYLAAMAGIIKNQGTLFYPL